MEESVKVTADEPLYVRRLSQDIVLFRDEEGKINCLQDTCALGIQEGTGILAGSWCHSQEADHPQSIIRVRGPVCR